MAAGGYGGGGGGAGDDAILPAGTLDRNRRNNYQAVLKTGSPLRAAGSALPLFALLSFLTTPYGLWCLALAFSVCSGFVTTDWVRDHPLRAFVQGTIVTAALSIASFIPFARLWERYYARDPGLRCQPNKTHPTEGSIATATATATAAGGDGGIGVVIWLRLLLSRSEVRLALSNLVLAAAFTAAVAVTHVTHPGYDLIYTDMGEEGRRRAGVNEDGGGGGGLLSLLSSSSSMAGDYAYLLASAVAYFVLIDAWAYVGHRLLHVPWLYKRVHKWHHAYKQPTAFSGLALHPVDMTLIQGGVYAGFYLLPMHPAAIAVNLLYVHYFNVVDHSGVYSESWLPWQPSSLYHDDHHRLFHVNYGQTLTLFDRLGGTFYTERKRYGEKRFSD